MNGMWVGLGIYVLLGIILIGVRWESISAIGRPMVGDRVNLAIPFLIAAWPFFTLPWISDEIKVWVSVRRANRMAFQSSCVCGKALRFTAAHIRELRDEGRSVVKCDCCGEITKLGAQRV